MGHDYSHECFDKVWEKDVHMNTFGSEIDHGTEDYLEMASTRKLIQVSENKWTGAYKACQISCIQNVKMAHLYILKNLIYNYMYTSIFSTANGQNMCTERQLVNILKLMNCMLCL